MPRKIWLGLIPLAGLFLYQFFQFDVLQDDAFISFPYIRNFLDGHGLVFNIGDSILIQTLPNIAEFLKAAKVSF